MKKITLLLLIAFAVANAHFVGSKNSDKYHNPDCSQAKKISPQNLVVFEDAEAAAKAGYIPCKVCKPRSSAYIGQSTEKNLHKTAVAGQTAFAETPRLQFEMLDVGQGLSFLIKSENCNALYDTGTPKSGIDTMLANRNIDTLCSVILSHWHIDHAGGLKTLAEMAKNQKLKIKRLIVSNDYPLKEYSAKVRESVFEDFAAAGIPVREIHRGDTIMDFAPFDAKILWPKAGDSSVTENSASTALYISDRLRGFLFMGDLGENQEHILLGLEPDLKAYFLQVGHHGSKTSSSLPFLKQIQPGMAFIGVGMNNSYKHPRPETLARLKQVMQDTTRIYRTDIHGSVKFEWIYGVVE
jgi:competence protein ComEC